MDTNETEGLNKNLEDTIRLKLAKYTRKRKLLCQNGFYLEIRDDGSVKGTEDPKSPYTALDVLSIGADMLTISGSKAKMYLAADKQGNIYATKTEGQECVFLELFTPEFFNVYLSFNSISDGRPMCLHLIPDDGKIEIKDYRGVPSRSGSFIWEVISWPTPTTI